MSLLDAFLRRYITGMVVIVVWGGGIALIGVSSWWLMNNYPRVHILVSIGCFAYGIGWFIDWVNSMGNTEQRRA